MTALADLIGEHWETWSEVGGPVVDRALLGTDHAADAAATVDAWCRERLGSGIADGHSWTTSVGCVALVTLADGSTVAVKVHQPDRTAAFLDGVQRVQSAVVAAGIAAPSPRAGPAPIRPGGPLATAESLVPDPGFTDGRAAGAAQAAARALAAATRATMTLPAGTITAHPNEAAPDRLWPPPHSPIFDFEATSDGAEWIDDLARPARQELDAARGPRVLVHHDWCSRNVRVRRGEVVAAYDWDSVSPKPVAVAAGQAAALWPCTGEADSPDASSPEEVDAFLRWFEAAWGEPFGPDGYRLARAGARYALAYTARCEHAIGREGAGLRALRAYAVGSS